MKIYNLDRMWQMAVLLFHNVGGGGGEYWHIKVYGDVPLNVPKIFLKMSLYF